MKKILSLLLILMLVPMCVFADGDNSTTVDTSPITSSVDESGNKVTDNTNTNADTGTPATKADVNVITDGNYLIDESITVDDVGNRIIDKLNQVAIVLRQIAFPIAVIMFVVGAILMVIGALGKKNGVQQGILVMVLSVITYGLCMYSQPIIKALVSWFAS